MAIIGGIPHFQTYPYASDSQSPSQETWASITMRPGQRIVVPDHGTRGRCGFWLQGHEGWETQQERTQRGRSNRMALFKWVCLKISYIPNYSHLIGIMISKTIGKIGVHCTLFSDTPVLCLTLFEAAARWHQIFWARGEEKRHRPLTAQFNETWRERSHWIPGKWGCFRWKNTSTKTIVLSINHGKKYS